MKKQDLKTGMRVELNNGEVYMVISNIDSGYGYQEKALINHDGFEPLSEYNENMELADGDDRIMNYEFDIAKVYSNYPSGKVALSGSLLDLSVKTLIWEREETPSIGRFYYIPCIGNETLFETIVWEDTEDNNRVRDTIGVFEKPAYAIERSKEILERWDDF